MGGSGSTVYGTLGLHDRQHGQGPSRIPFLSAMSMLNANDNETHSYLEIVDALRQFGASPKEDIRSLWRRIVFNIMIANTDDHLRNHAFLYDGSHGWRLAPAYDLNPVPLDIKPRNLSLNITEDDNTGSLELACEVSPYFELTLVEAQVIIAEVRSALSMWRQEAKSLELPEPEISRMASAFLK